MRSKTVSPVTAKVCILGLLTSRRTRCLSYLRGMITPRGSPGSASFGRRAWSRTSDPGRAHRCRRGVGWGSSAPPGRRGSGDVSDVGVCGVEASGARGFGVRGAEARWLRVVCRLGRPAASNHRRRARRVHRRLLPGPGRAGGTGANPGRRGTAGGTPAPPPPPSRPSQQRPRRRRAADEHRGREAQTAAAEGGRARREAGCWAWSWGLGSPPFARR